MLAFFDVSSEKGTDPRPARAPHEDLRGVLHDVSNALTVILGWVNKAQESESLPTSVQEALDIVAMQARIAKSTARRAIGAAPSERTASAFDLAEEVARALRVEAKTRSVRIRVHSTGAEALLARADDAFSAVVNLVLNALAFSPAGAHVHIRVRVEGTLVALEVHDEGPGVPEHRRATLFDGVTTRVGGTGNGLRHARALAQSVGGDLVLVPSPKGANFRLTWPVGVGLVAVQPSNTPSELPTGGRVLILDDDDAITQLLEAALEARGMSVVVLRSIVDLEATLRGGTFDAALVDMSPLGGRPERYLSRIGNAVERLVLITGNVDSVPELTLLRGARLVRKPFEVRDVLGALVGLGVPVPHQ